MVGEFGVCRISALSEDWINKGFHIHIHGIELAMRPDHLGGIVFKKCFARDSDRDVEPAVKIAMQLLEDAAWRARFREHLIRARGYVLHERGRLRSLANGRSFEFQLLIKALDRREAKA